MKNWLILAFSLFCLALVIQEILTYGIIKDMLGGNEELGVMFISIISVLGFFYLWKKNFFQRDN